MGVKTTLNRIAIVEDALLRSRIQSSYRTGKTVLIVFQQVFGDSVILQNSLVRYISLFPKSEGYRIKLLVRPSVLRFMQENLVLPQDMEYEEVDFKKFLESYEYYRTIVRKYSSTASLLIVPGTSLSAEIFATASNAARRVGLVRCMAVTHPYIYALFYKLAYTEQVVPSKDDMMLQRHRLLLAHLGDNTFRAGLPQAIVHKRVICKDRYAVLCPGSSKTEKCWPIDRFAKVADYIIENYGMDIHLCGGAEEKSYEEALMGYVKNKENVISHIGATTFSQWSAIVEYADLVLGNDSATMHLAAAHRRNAICIAGVYDKYQFFPYKVDVLENGDRLPVTVLKEMPCEYCRTIGYDAGYGNAECAARIKRNQCAMCIEQISVDEIIAQINQVMKGEQK